MMQPDGKRSLQWGNASSADTTTGQTGATPTPPHQPKDSTSASAAEHPFSPSEGSPVWLHQLVQDLNNPPLPDFKPFNLSKQGYLVSITDEQRDRADVYPVRILPPEVVAFNREVQLEQTRQLIAGITARLALAPEALHPVIELHSPTEYEECQGCDGGPDTSGDWPCRTIDLILEGLE